MADLGFEFDVNDAPEPMYELVPEGEYTVAIVEAERNQTKNGDGVYLSLKFMILGPTNQGRYLWSNLNIVNPNPKSEQIAKADLGAICKACGVQVLRDTSQIENNPILCRVKHKPRRDTGEMQAVIGGYKPTGRTRPQATQAPPAETRQAATPTPFDDCDPF